ncbi:5479_t:CDS:2 [Funneliformis geosporum]|uniref:15158_t:CDS:1 n=1 Tax=Funneliformis geosporum TaxID=1117311 RepID=A0A9W4T2Q1_9GLOM|nr:5479_t:CDS:2 [Funneliformis geosporum]CAI2189898.1 15158_t:CDS:2 [Funneliformis geosporum]
MDGLKLRHAQANGVGPDPVELLDEQGQEEVIEELRKQNERANGFFKKALAFVSALVLILHLIFVYEIMSSSSLSNPIIPFPIFEHIYSSASYKMIATLSSIGALVFSIYLLQATNVTMLQIYAGAFLSIIPNLLAIHTERMEKLWWAIPLGLLILDTIALFLIKDSEQDIRSLEKLKYKYKGA